VRNGTIVAVGTGLDTPADVTVFEAKGKSVTAGLFNSSTQLGVVEVGAIAETNDYSSDNKRFTAALKVADAVNPSSTLIPQNRMHGLTHALVMPRAKVGIFAGQAAIIQLGTAGNTVVNDSVAVVVELGEAGAKHVGGSRAVALAILREALDDARDFRDNREEVLRGNRRDYALSLADLSALEPVITGDKPLIVTVHRASDISAVLALGKAYQLKLILSGATEGWRVADAIAAAAIPVIANVADNLPDSYEKLGARLDNVARLDRAGVTVLLMGMNRDQTHNAYLVRQAAGNAVANGMLKSAAIAAMTSNPARIFGLQGAGDIALGNAANLVVWGGDPLELTSEAELVLINGKNIPLVSRSTQLRDRYFQKLQKD
jgi:imidazolonepropionase-like amidohydrolase